MFKISRPHVILIKIGKFFKKGLLNPTGTTNSSEYSSKYCFVIKISTYVSDHEFAPGVSGLTLSCLKIFMTRVVWTLASFEYNIGINYEFTKIFEGELCVEFLSTFLLQTFSENSFCERDITIIVRFVFAKLATSSRRVKHDCVRS